MEKGRARNALQAAVTPREQLMRSLRAETVNWPGQSHVTADFGTRALQKKKKMRAIEMHVHSLTFLCQECLRGLRGSIPHEQ